MWHPCATKTSPSVIQRQEGSLPVGLAGRGASLARKALAGHAGGALVTRIVVKGDHVRLRRRQQPRQERGRVLVVAVGDHHPLRAGWASTHSRVRDVVQQACRAADSSAAGLESVVWLRVCASDGQHWGVPRAMVAGRPVTVCARRILRADPLRIHPHSLVGQVLQDVGQAAKRHAVRQQQDCLPPAPTPWEVTRRMRAKQ